MAGTSLLALIDDIASVLDDVATMTKVATKKTAGVLGDDLALNAQQVAGVSPSRELPVVWAVAGGSLKNKLILVPGALATSAVAPWLVPPLLMAGGAFLCYEGFEKLAHKYMHRKTDREHRAPIPAGPVVDMVAPERDCIQGAIRTDFILSAEITAIVLATVASQPIGLRAAVLSGTALIMTAGVYGLVAAIVRLDDGGLFLSQQRGMNLMSRIARATGAAILQAAPYLMKSLSMAGTAAMFIVGGGILAHGIPGIEDVVHTLADGAKAAPVIGRLLAAGVPLLLDFSVGLIAGAVALAVVSAWRLSRRGSKTEQDRSMAAVDGQQ